MIFTSRFGALAARPIFITAPQQENASELETSDVEHHWSDVPAA